MFSVSQLGKHCGVSRTTILYYEREGLLKPAQRGENGYRWYGDNELQRLQTITAYRSYGLPIAHIRTLLAHQGQSQTKILKDHFKQLEKEINQLRAQQKAIVVLLQEPHLLEENIVTKQRWVNIMIAAGFSEADMTRWHQKFEQLEPQEHQKFLVSLGISAEEIKRIRAL